MFDWEPGIALPRMQGNRASTLATWEISWVFSSCVRNLEYILELRRGCPFGARVCSAMSGQLSRYDGHLRNVTRLGGTIWMLLEVKREIRPPFLVGKGILGFLSIFKKSQASSPFEALEWPNVRQATCLV